ncbi:MAG: ABC transporter permease [Actinomycetota bacterium]|nr:ABC transporter permease [Actinomycetota bacterium]
MRARLRELLTYREVLVNLIRKELKVKYTASVLGAVWSLLNPVVFLAVFSFVVAVLRVRIPDFPVFLLSGLLAWNLLSNALQAGARSVIDNANLVKKMAFPREILPLSAVGVAAFDFLLQSAVLLLFIAVSFVAVSGPGFHLPEMMLYPLAIAVLLVFTMALTFWVAALNVRYRDVGHLLNLALLVWFWATPIVYQGWLVQRKLEEIQVLGLDAWLLYLLNPVAVIVLGFQRALYAIVIPAPGEDPILPLMSLGELAGMLLAVLAVSILLLFSAWRSFFRSSGDFAEEL